MENRKKSAKERGGSVEGEWLHDFTCVKYDAHGWLKGIAVAAEYEWDGIDAIEPDFQKLLAAHADVRVMIFDGASVDPSETIGTW